jgi:AcrR family transcriptional regulator
MRQEIIQAAQEIIRERGVDGLSMRAIARIVHTSPANLYEYFLNKEEIIFSVYNEVLTNLQTALQQVPTQPAGRTYLLALCLTYIDFIHQDPYQIQIISYQHQFEQIKVGVYATDGAANNPVSFTTAGQGADPVTTAYLENTKAIYNLFLQAIEQCIVEGSLSTSSLQAAEMSHIIWAFVHGLITLSIQEVSTIKRETIQKALETFLNGFAI